MIAIGSDHAGFLMKEEIVKLLQKQGFEIKNVGTQSEDSCDYPVFAKKVCDLVNSGECEKGILVCGTGIGMSMAANKEKNIRAAVCTTEKEAEFTRLHNDANVLCLGARIIDQETAEKLVEIFLKTEFMGGKHLRRIQMFS